MGEVTPSFLADISKYEETLAKDPDSFCFAPLADLYRKNGLIDEAINIATKGCDTHPSYVGGFLALGRAYYEKGMMEDSKTALEKVIAATPDNHLAQKLLSQVYLKIGDTASAATCLKVMLSTNADDMESRELLNSLQVDDVTLAKTAGGASEEDSVLFDTKVVDGTALEHELSLNDVEIIEDLIEEVADVVDPGVVSECSAAVTDQKDPLKTATLAELYVSQGFLSSAISIYKELLIADPCNEEYKKRLLDIEQAFATKDQQETGETAFAAAESEDTPAGGMSQAHSPSNGDCLYAVAVLETWLANIQRRH